MTFSSLDIFLQCRSYFISLIIAWIKYSIAKKMTPKVVKFIFFIMFKQNQINNKMELEIQ